jgi:hypothetical protein
VNNFIGTNKNFVLDFSMNRAAKHFENHQRKYRKTDFILEASKKYYSREYS